MITYTIKINIESNEIPARSYSIEQKGVEREGISIIIDLLKESLERVIKTNT